MGNIVGANGWILNDIFDHIPADVPNNSFVVQNQLKRQNNRMRWIAGFKLFNCLIVF